MNIARVVFLNLITLAVTPIAFGKASCLSQVQSPSGQESQATQSPSVATRPIEKKITAYALPPDLYKKAKALSRTRFRFNIINFLYGLLILWIILHCKLGPKFRDRA